MIKEKAVYEAALAEDTICPACGDTGGEKRYECFRCGEAVVLPAKEVAFILANVERDDEENENGA